MSKEEPQQPEQQHLSLGIAIAVIAVVLVVHVGLWMAYVVNPSPAEWVLGGVAAVISTAAVYTTGYVYDARFHPSLGMLAQGVRIPWYVLTGTWDLLVAIYLQIFTRRGADSAMVAIPFDCGRHEDSRDAGRRTLAVTYTTLTPNSIVIGLVPEEQLMLYYQVVPGPTRQMTKNLGAQR